MNLPQTERLLIAGITLEDAAFIVKLLNTENWIRYIGDRNVHTIKEAKNYLKNGILKSYQEKGFGFYKLLLKENNEPIGICGFVKRKELADVDLGFALLPRYEGKGYGYEAASALLVYAKEVLNFKRIGAITLPDNRNSIHLLEKIGLTYEKSVNLFDDKEELLFFAKEL